MREQVKKLIAMRRNSMPLLYGDLQTEELNDDEWEYSRTYMGQKVSVKIDRKEMTFEIEEEED
jgi:hypothetical protein